jgi:hypothetical protein
MDLGLHIAVHARKKSFLRHTAGRSPLSHESVNNRPVCHLFSVQRDGHTTGFALESDSRMGSVVTGSTAGVDVNRNPERHLQLH